MDEPAELQHNGQWRTGTARVADPDDVAQFIVDRWPPKTI